MRRLLPFTLHAAAAVIMAWGWFNLPEVHWMQVLKGGGWLFLTNQGLALAWLYMVISLLHDVFPTIATVHNIRRSLLIISMPLASVISSIYWTLISTFPHLILRRGLRGSAELIYIPIEIDLALHASPIVTLLIDFFAFQSRFSKAQVQRIAPVAIVTYAVGYASFVEYCATFNKSFPYPFLTDNPFQVRVLIYAATAGIALGCFRTLNALHA